MLPDDKVYCHGCGMWVTPDGCTRTFCEIYLGYSDDYSEEDDYEDQ